MKFTELTKNGKFIITSELGPPKGFHIEKALHEAEVVWPYVNAINVTDNQSSVMRLGGLAMCKALLEKNIEPVFQVTCRDRNRLALQSDILSAALFGIDNLLLLTGDHTTLGDHKEHQWSEQQVRRSEEWWAALQPIIQTFWEDVEKAKRGEFTVPESSRPAKKAKTEQCMIKFNKLDEDGMAIDA